MKYYEIILWESTTDEWGNKVQKTISINEDKLIAIKEAQKNHTGIWIDELFLSPSSIMKIEPSGEIKISSFEEKQIAPAINIEKYLPSKKRKIVLECMFDGLNRYIEESNTKSEVVFSLKERMENRLKSIK